MLTTRTNVHHSTLPRLGAIGYLIEHIDRWGDVRYWFGRRQRYQCVAYPVCDSADWRYSRGIHTAWFRNLRNGKLVQMSGFYFDEAL